MNKRIVKLTVENVKRIKAVTIEPTTNVITVGGRNGQGKTSTLDAIAMALGGANEVCSKPIRSGEKSASIDLDLGDIIVSRRFTASGSTLEVKSKDGAKYPSPQAMLDKLTGKISFDPLSFTRLEAKKQLTALQRVVGLDVTEFDTKRAKVFAERADVNRDGKAIKAKWDALPLVNAPDEEVSAAEMTERLKAAETHNKQVDELGRRSVLAAKSLERAKSRVAELEDELLAARIAAEAHADAVQELSGLLADSKLIETDPILAEIRNAEEVNKAVRQKQQRLAVGKELDAIVEKSETLTKALAAIDEEKAAALAAATFPVPGLSFGEDGITFGGVPFEQCSGAEQLRVSVAMGLAINPELKVLLVRDGSLLDADSMRILEDMAAAADAQIWLEVVSNSGEGCSVIIENGEVQETPAH